MQNVSFTSPFYTAPVVLATVLNGGNNKASVFCPVKDPLSCWMEVQYIPTTLFKTNNKNIYKEKETQLIE